jgi:glycolate oxidase FAD binding subunit
VNVLPTDLKSRTRVLELTPEDMTVTVESGINLGALQKELARHRQWLPIDPPNAETTTIHDLLARDLSGPRRFGYGTIREHLIGMKVALTDGLVIKSGGKVVKNVAGYDLAKLFIGARLSLGIIIEATFKLRPLPEVERIIGARFAITEASQAIRSVLNSELTPVVLDLHRLGGIPEVTLVIGVAGARAEVEWQLKLAAKLGVQAEATLDYEAVFWNDSAPVQRFSALPSRLMEGVAKLGNRPFVARAGNGTIYHRGDRVGPAQALPMELMRRVKAAYDPKNILPEFKS